jgi:hypothetical protein
MRQTRVAKRRPGPASWPQMLPPDPRDPDILSAHQITRRAGHPLARITSGRRSRDLPSSPRLPAEPVYRFRTRLRYCDLLFGRMGWLRQDRGLCPFACST